jgi:hypothetical protein
MPWLWPLGGLGAEADGGHAVTADLSPRDPDAAEKARATFAQALADLDLTVSQRMAVKAAAEDFGARLVEAHARSPYPRVPKPRREASAP